MDAALRTVLAVREVEELTALREENQALRYELRLWKGHKELPVEGEYYFADEKLLESHGWEFHEECALRYDGVVEEEKEINEWIGQYLVTKKKSYLFHVFTAPYMYDEDDFFQRTGWTKFKLETYELHNTFKVREDELENETKYLDENDEVQVWEPNNH